MTKHNGKNEIRSLLSIILLLVINWAGTQHLPKINLKDPFNDLKEFQQRIPVPPDITELDSLELQGQIRFNGKVTLKGNVRLISDTKKIRIPKGAVLDNKIIES